MEIQFNFDELQIPELGEGALFYGNATLESAYEDDSEFYVSEIVLTGGRVISASGVGAGSFGFPCEFNKAIFKAISSIIESDKTPLGQAAAREWSDAVSGEYVQTPNVYSTLSHRTQGLSVRGATL